MGKISPIINSCRKFGGSTVFVCSKIQCTKSAGVAPPSFRCTRLHTAYLDHSNCVAACCSDCVAACCSDTAHTYDLTEEKFCHVVILCSKFGSVIVFVCGQSNARSLQESRNLFVSVHACILRIQYVLQSLLHCVLPCV